MQASITSLGGKRRSREQIAELVREFKCGGTTRRKFSESWGLGECFATESEDLSAE